MNTENTTQSTANSLYLRAAVILLALNFALNGYFVYTVLKVSELNQDATIATAIKTVKK